MNLENFERDLLEISIIIRYWADFFLRKIYGSLKTLRYYFYPAQMYRKKIWRISLRVTRI